MFTFLIMVLKIKFLYLNFESIQQLPIINIVEVLNQRNVNCCEIDWVNKL